MEPLNASSGRISTGISGLDHVLCGGLIPRRAYLVNGPPGSGKTTLGLHFLTAGRPDEKCLFVTLTEPVESIVGNARALGFDLARVEFLDLTPTAQFFAEAQSYDIFLPADVERQPMAQRIVETVTALSPSRVFIDSMTSFRYLATDPYEFRRQALSFLRFLVESGATVVFTSEASPEAPDEDLQFISDGIISLSYDRNAGRGLEISKFRGSDFEPGRHAVVLHKSGMDVYPNVHPVESHAERSLDMLSTGIKELDELFGGGIERGTITLLTGPTGTGKTSLAVQLASASAARGERTVFFSFEEEVDLIAFRARSLGIRVDEMIAAQRLSLVKVEPLRYTPQEFYALVEREVAKEGARMVVIDSTAGYKLSLRGIDLASHLHALAKFLQAMNVTTVLITETHDVTGDFRPTDEHVSFIGDNIVFLRYLEIDGELKKAIGVLKKRLSNFEKTLREFELTPEGIRIGEPLTKLRGILRGIPDWKDS